MRTATALTLSTPPRPCLRAWSSSLSALVGGYLWSDKTNEVRYCMHASAMHAGAGHSLNPKSTILHLFGLGPVPTPNTSREEEICKWDDSARERSNLESEIPLSAPNKMRAHVMPYQGRAACRFREQRQTSLKMCRENQARERGRTMSRYRKGSTSTPSSLGARGRSGLVGLMHDNGYALLDVSSLNCVACIMSRWASSLPCPLGAYVSLVKTMKETPECICIISVTRHAGFKKRILRRRS